VGRAIWSCGSDKFSNFEELIERYQKKLPDSTERLVEPAERENR